MTRLSDSHSIEVEFENLDICVDDLMFAEVSGMAELARDDDGEFYVKHIVLAGDRRDRTWLARRHKSHVHLYRPSPDWQTFTAHLFRAIERALYQYEPAKEAWLNEIREAEEAA